MLGLVAHVVRAVGSALDRFLRPGASASSEEELVVISLRAPIDTSRYPAVAGWGDARAANGTRPEGIHEGLDFHAPSGTPVYACDAGRVVRSERSEEVEGEWIAVQHAWGLSRYMHLAKRARQVGETVAPGDILGASGRSGIKNSPSHLHFDCLLADELLESYRRTFGEPAGGFGRRRGRFVAVPAEALLPASACSSVVKANAARRGVKFRAAELGALLFLVALELAIAGGLS